MSSCLSWQLSQAFHEGNPTIPDGASNPMARIQRELEAIRLIELGARANLICQLTDVNKQVVSRLYRQLTGAPSAPGLTPFTDTWYIKNDRLMLHVSVVWRLFRQTADFGCSAAQQLIAVYQAYVSLVKTPLLNITRVHFVTRLVTTLSWEERGCPECRANYLAPVDRLARSCYGCTLYFDQRCRHCNATFPLHKKGRPRKRCLACGLVR